MKYSECMQRIVNKLSPQADVCPVLVDGIVGGLTNQLAGTNWLCTNWRWFSVINGKSIKLLTSYSREAAHHGQIIHLGQKQLLLFSCTVPISRADALFYIHQKKLPLSLLGRW